MNQRSFRVYTRAQLTRIARRQESCREILCALGFTYSPRPVLRIRFSWSSTTPSTTILRRFP